MNRVEELTFRLIQGDLSAAEQAELDGLLAQDELARHCHVGLLRLEAALLGEGRPADVAESTVAHVKDVSAADLEQSVMRTIAALPSPRLSRAASGISWTRLHGRFVGIFSACLATAAAVLLVVWLVPNSHRQPVESREENPAAETAVVILEKADGVQIDGALVTVGQQVQPGQTIDTQEDEFAVLQYPDGTRLELYGRTRVCLERVQGGGKRLRLEAGMLHADVKPQPQGLPLVVVTSHTELRVLGTRFRVTSFQEECTRVDLESGKVEVIPSEGPAVTLEAGSVAYVSPGQPPRLVKAKPPFQDHTSRELTFRGLRSVAFAPDGQTIIATTNWQAVYWHPSDVLEAVPVSPNSRRGREGITIEGQAGPMLAFADRKQKQLVVWDAINRKPQFVCESPEGLVAIASVSPRGDWLVAWDVSEGMKMLRLYRAGQAGPAFTLNPRKVTSVASSADGTLLAVGRMRTAVDVVEAATGRVLAELPMKQKVPLALAFSTDGNLLAVGLTGRVELWDVNRKEVVATFEQPGLPLTRVLLGPHGKHLVAASVDDSVWIWNVDQPNEPVRLQARQRIQGLAFSPDGETLAVLCQRGWLGLWKLSE